MLIDLISKHVSRRDFFKAVAQSTAAISGGLSLDVMLKGCATAPLLESSEDVAKIKWDTNPAIPVPRGCSIGWHTEMIQQVRAPYMASFENISAKGASEFLEHHINKFGFLPKVFSFADRAIGHQTLDFPVEICKGIEGRGVIPLIRFYYTAPFGTIVHGA